MPKTINRELLAGFTDEVKTYLPRIRASVDTLRADPSRMEVLEETHRLVHSIKGAASMLGLSALSHIAFLQEEAIEEIACGQLLWSEAAASAINHALELMTTYLERLSAGTLQERPILSEAVKALRRLRSQPESGDEAEIDLLLGNEGDPVVEGAPAAPAPAASATPAAVPAEPFRSIAKANQVTAVNIPADVLETFQEEAEEILHTMGELLDRLEGGGTDRHALLEIRRSAHTLKGAAGSVGLRALSSLAHRMEDLLDAINQDTLPYTSDIHSLLRATFDLLGDMAAAHQTDMSAQTDALYTRYAGVLNQQAPPPAPPTEEAASRAALPIELLESFRAETEEHVAKVAAGLRTLESNPEDKPVILEVRRTFHTVKGASNMVGMRAMSTLAHATENLLDAAYREEFRLNADHLSLLSAVADTLGDLAAGEHDEEAVRQSIDLIERLAAYNPDAEQPVLGPLEAEKAISIPQAAAQTQEQGAVRRSGQYVRVPLERLDDLVRLVSELLVSRSTFEQHLAAYSREIEELSRSTGRLRRISSRIDTDFEVSALRSGMGQLAVRAIFTGPQTEDRRKDFDALEFDRYTDFHLLSRDLTEASADIGSASSELAHRVADFDGHLNRLGRLTSEVQDKLMRMRMVPMSTLSTRLRRTVRVTSERRQKPVELILEGEHVELDKTVLEEICAPLEHLLRNAVDHGIETPATRQVLGKPMHGQIRLRVYHEGTEVVIQVIDDGGGMEPDLLREAAVRAGICSEAEAAQMPASALYNLIFTPGFTTARTVSETSGRGVGMDIVKSTINKMKGTMSVETEPNRGTTFSIRLPMTLAIMRVLLVEANGETLAVPLSVVTQILRIEPEQIEHIGEQTVIRVDGKVVPALRLGEALRLPRPADSTVKRLPALIVTIGDRQIAFIVERLVEAREVVVKNMGSLLRRVDGITGATLMGDGSVVLIVNPTDVAPALDENGGGFRQVSAAPRPAQTHRGMDVLIVDDSVSVRRVLSNLVRNKGWNPLTARDGVEALEILEHSERVPDVVLLDIEMPRMDGYELLTALREHNSYKRLPVIMLTSRAGEKHRRKAFDLGATDYLVKPYEEETLVTVMRRVVREARETPVS